MALKQAGLESTKLTKKKKKLNIIGRLSLPKKTKNSLGSAKRIDRTYQIKTKNWTCITEWTTHSSKEKRHQKGLKQKNGT